MIRRVIVLEDAARDIEAAIDFYETAEPGVGDYFRDSIIADLRRLAHYFGQHAVHFGFNRALSDRFPYAIYYRDDDPPGTRVASMRWSSVASCPSRWTASASR